MLKNYPNQDLQLQLFVFGIDWKENFESFKN